MKNQQMQKEKQEKEDVEMMKKKMEADEMYHLFEEEKLRQRYGKLEAMARTNLKQAVYIFLNSK
jgi:hypothetical protein